MAKKRETPLDRAFAARTECGLYRDHPDWLTDIDQARAIVARAADALADLMERRSKIVAVASMEYLLGDEP